MKKILCILFISFFGIFAGFYANANTQGMMGDTARVSESHAAREEAEGKAIWEKFQAKQLTCDTMTDDNFEVIGEYSMGRILGPSHEQMNIMMRQMMGEKGEEQMHIVMGKRISECDTNAVFPSQGVGFLPMFGFGMMGGGGNTMGNFGFTQIGIMGFFFMLLWFILIIAGVIGLARWIFFQANGKNIPSPLDILKNRYAKGEIDRKEFEEKKKDIT